ncbi:glucokinase [Aquipluma nitroreducens]|uniref:Glucokinase n=1 Tax=Aquipluma nitroreducens TaxID=2010828 RepID=A0A5K7S8A6_9BACT|nr:ROK family protein [Aquipluma nitroreducens]BBE17554.1 glucokinase [Aquipluma nitroreducens]
MTFSQVNQDEGSDMNVVELKNNFQKRKIIKNLFLYGAMTNTDLGQFVKLSTPKIISLLNELKAEGLVEELGQGNSSGGRRPNLYGNKEDAFYIIGISINIYKTSVSIFNAKNQKVTDDHILTLTISHGTTIIDPIVDFTENVIREKQIPREKILGIGIEMPGMVDSETGINKTYMVSDQPVAEVFRKKFGMEVLIENDAKTRAFAELRFGLAHGRKNILAIHLDWGIGLGIIVNGKLYKGRDGFAGEFGHLPMVDNGILCKCGKQGCLETIASGTAIARMAKEGMAAGRSTFLGELKDHDQENNEIRQVVQAATMGDQYSISILANVGHWLGKGLAYLIQIFNPELIILGGRMSEANQFILPPIQQSIQIFCNPELGNEIEIKVSELGSKAGIQGVAALFLEHVLDRN